MSAKKPTPARKLSECHCVARNCKGALRTNDEIKKHKRTDDDTKRLRAKVEPNGQDRELVEDVKPHEESPLVALPIKPGLVFHMDLVDLDVALAQILKELAKCMPSEVRLKAIEVTISDALSIPILQDDRSHDAVHQAVRENALLAQEQICKLREERQLLADCHQGAYETGTYWHRGSLRS